MLKTIFIYHLNLGWFFYAYLTPTKPYINDKAILMRFKTFYCQNDKLYIQDVRVAKNGIKMRSGAFYDIRY